MYIWLLHLLKQPLHALLLLKSAVRYIAGFHWFPVLYHNSSSSLHSSSLCILRNVWDFCSSLEVLGVLTECFVSFAELVPGSVLLLNYRSVSVMNKHARRVKLVCFIINILLYNIFILFFIISNCKGSCI